MEKVLIFQMYYNFLVYTSLIVFSKRPSYKNAFDDFVDNFVDNDNDVSKCRIGLAENKESMKQYNQFIINKKAKINKESQVNINGVKYIFGCTFYY